MTKEEAKEFLEKEKEFVKTIEGYIEGKTIQVFYGNVWHDCVLSTEIQFDMPHKHYRIKPEPKYRPYANAKEFLEAAQLHGPYIRSKTNPDHYLIPGFVGNATVVLNGEEDKQPSFTDLLRNKQRWQDGTICGILEE